MVKGLEARPEVATVVLLHDEHPSAAVFAERHGGRSLDGRTPLGPGLFVVPHDKTASFAEDALVPASANADRLGPLVASAAGSFGDRLIVVLQAGASGQDAQASLAAVDAGGTLLVERPRPGKPTPRSLPETSIDVVARAENIPAIVTALLNGAGSGLETDEERLRPLLDLIQERSGIDFTRHKTPTIARRLQRRMAAVGSTDLDAYVELCRSDPGEYQKLISAFLIGVTEFFRDAPVFDYIRQRVLPCLIASRRETGRVLRLWSAGCATGEEAYSLAMVVADALGDELPAWQVRLFATDLDPDAITFARRGIYPAAAARAVPAELRQRYLLPRGDELEVGPDIRRFVVFGQHDLAERAPFPRCDVIVCRNVLIYFTQELQTRTLQLFAFSLQDDGYLVIGPADSEQALPGYFVIEQERLKVFRRAGERHGIPPPRGGTMASAAAPAYGALLRSPAAAQAAPAAGHHRPSVLQREQGRAALAAERPGAPSVTPGNGGEPSATEELRAINEQLEATNEELEALNEELQFRAERQRETGSRPDPAIGARGPHPESPLLVVGADGARRLANAAYDREFGDESPLTATMLARVRRGEEFDELVRVAALGDESRLFRVRGEPVRSEGADDGSVVSFTAIGDSGAERPPAATRPL
jgi:chemotaxis methyl-accepting protein methylase